MAYGQIKVDTITFTDGGIDKSVSISGLVQNPTFSGNITATGTISGNTLQGQMVSGVTATGTTAQFASGTFTSLTGTTTTGTTASFATGVFISITGTKATITSGIFASGTAAEPSVSVGTTDNGLYSPSTDNVAISTNGTGRLFVDASGDVGVNTSPDNIGRMQLKIGNYTANLPANGYYLTGSAGPLSSNNGWIAGLTLESNASGAPILALRSPNSVTAGSQTTQKSLEIIGAGSGQQLLLYGGGNEAIRIDSSGRLLVGASTAISTNSVTAGVELFSTATDNGASLSIARFNNDTSGGQLILAKSRNATIATGTIVQNGDDLGQLVFNGDDGTDLNTPAARIQCFVDGTPGTNDMPGRLVFSTTADGASSPTERMRITSDGKLGLGTSNPESRLHVTGTSATTNNGATVLIEDSASLAADVGGSVAFRGTDGTTFRTYGIIRGGKSTATSGVFDGYLAFETRTNGQANTSEKLRITSAGVLQIADAGNIAVGTTTGTKIGTATSQKIGFYNKTPVVQPTTGVTEAAFVENSGGTAVNVDSTFGGYTIRQVVQALQNLGLLA